MNLFKSFKNKFFLGLILFCVVFSVFAFSIQDLWFSMDDLGNIINGLIKNFDDFIKVFSEDERNYIYPINFNVPHANFISGFYRPLQHIPFSIIYFLRDFDAYSFFLCNVFFHALNSFLFFYIISFFVSIELAFLGGVLFAFYPSYDWIVWISTLHNFLAVFFMLLALLFYRKFLVERNCVAYYFSGLMLLLSLLSRENTIFLGMWLLIGAYLFLNTVDQGFWTRIKYAFSKTYVFLLGYLIYFLLRLNAFGYKTLPRTIEHFCMKFAFLKIIFGNSVGDQSSNVSSMTNQVVQILNKNIVVAQIERNSFWGQFLENVKHWLCWIKMHLSLFFNFYDDSNSGIFFLAIVTIFVMLFLFFAYRRHIKLLIFLFLGILLFSWPSFVAYPNPRYANAVYPFLIFIILIGINFYKEEDLKTPFKRSVFTIMLFLLLFSAFSGVRKNISSLKSGAVSTFGYREKFVDFFNKNVFDKNDNFIIVGSPFVSDIQNIFQVFLKNINLKLALVRDSTLAQRGCMGCPGNYRISGVKSKIVPIRIGDQFGLRLISLDKEHCAWWMDFSFFPLKWSREERAYVWTVTKPVIGFWHDFSMGKFLINERLEDRYITDVIFLFDDEWIDQNTVFVTWDTMEGKYSVLGKAQDIFKGIE